MNRAGKIYRSIDFIIDLLEADQVVVGGVITYYLKGSGQTVILHKQDISGNSSCATDVSITAP